MLPIGDDDSGRRLTPIVTYALIAANVLFFLLELNSGEAFIERWAFVPSSLPGQPGRRICNHFYIHVHACGLVASIREYALLMDLRR